MSSSSSLRFLDTWPSESQMAGHTSGGVPMVGAHPCEPHARPSQDDLGEEEEEEGIYVGCNVLVHGLKQAEHLNNLVGQVEGYDSKAERYLIRFAPRLTPSKIRACNLKHPVQCPFCLSEVSGTRCFACPSGELLVHESIRSNASSMKDLQTEASLLSSRPLPGPTRSGTPSALLCNDAGDNDSRKHSNSEMKQDGAMTSTYPCNSTQ